MRSERFGPSSASSSFVRSRPCRTPSSPVVLRRKSPDRDGRVLPGPVRSSISRDSWQLRACRADSRPCHRRPVDLNSRACLLRRGEVAVDSPDAGVSVDEGFRAVVLARGSERLDMIERRPRECTMPVKLGVRVRRDANTSSGGELAEAPHAADPAVTGRVETYNIDRLIPDQPFDGVAARHFVPSANRNIDSFSESAQELGLLAPKRILDPCRIEGAPAPDSGGGSLKVRAPTSRGQPRVIRRTRPPSARWRATRS